MYTSRKPQSGISLIELIIFIVIISVALAGILLVMNRTTASSSDPLIRKQAIAIAESMLEEVELQDFVAQAADTPVPSPPASRSSTYHIINNYNGFTTTGIYAPDGTAVPGLGNYNVAVAVANETLGGIASSVRITVTVTNTAVAANDPLRQTVIDGYRTAYR